jgi:hypothetical protein
MGPEKFDMQIYYRCRDSSVGIVMGWMTGVRFPAAARYFSFFGGKVAGD